MFILTLYLISCLGSDIKQEYVKNILDK